ncbi:MAG: hypothetical protein R6W90_18005 [Ignavibacteriaceae bacterium]
MSWFFGYTGVHNPSIENYIGSINNAPGFKVIGSKNIKLIFNENDDNILYDLESSGKGIVISGMPVYDQKLLDISEIRNISWPNGKATDGHFAAVRFDEHSIELFNDPLGLRDIYTKREGENIIFSTRIDIIIKYSGTHEINLKELSTLWLLPHQISWGTLIKGIEKLGPGGKLVIKNNDVNFRRVDWHPDFTTRTNTNDFYSNLHEAVTLPFRYGCNLNLGLSGGIDSRVLLQILLSSRYKNWGTHTFGDESLPDGFIAKKISDEMGLKHYFLKNSEPELNSLFENYSLQLGLSASVSEMINYPFYSFLKDEGYTVIDGAYGEIFRRAYLNRFLFTGREALLNKDVSKIFSLLTKEKAGIFNTDVNIKLTEFAKENVNQILNELDSPADIGAENWLDMFFIKTKVANVSGPSQALLDTISFSYMPLIQPSVLSSGFSLNPSEKKNESFFKSIIKNGNNNLSSYPLVKDNIYYPFGLNMFSSRVLQKIKKRLGFVYKNKTKYRILLGLRNYAQDRLNSQDVRSFDMYDIKKIDALIRGYYEGGKIELSAQVEWWITFEIWRESISKG